MKPPSDPTPNPTGRTNRRFVRNCRAVPPLDTLGQKRVARGLAGSFEGLAHHEHHLAQGERLLDGENSTEEGDIAQEIQTLGLAAPGHSNDGSAGSMTEELDDGFEAVLVRHVKIGDYQVGSVISPELDRLTSIRCLNDIVAGSAKQRVERAAHTGVVVDHHDPLPSPADHYAHLI